MATEWKVTDGAGFLDKNSLEDVKIESLADLVALLKKHETLVLTTHCWEPDVIHVEATNETVSVDDGYPDDDWW